MPNQALIRLDNIRCHLTREQQFNQLSWQLLPNENWVFYGPNGSGKTALAKVISKQLPISSGERIYADGFEPAHDIVWVSAEAQQQLQEHDQRFDDSEMRADAFDNGTRVYDVIFDGHTPTAEQLELLKSLGIDRYQDNGIRFVSSGQMRKALMLRAFVRAPKVMIVDDPLAGLDAESRDGITAMLQLIAMSDTQLILLLRRKQDVVAGIDAYALLDDCRIVGTGDMSQGLPEMLEHGAAQAAIPLNLALQREPIISNAELVRLVNIRANYRDKVIFEQQNFNLLAGQHAAVSGPNGCGKSTLLNLITGENHMAYGQEVWLFGKRRGSGESVWDIKQKFGIVSNAIHEKYGRGWSVLQVVISGLYDSIGLYDTPSFKDEMAARSCLRFMDIHALEKRKFSQLSFGQQRLVLLARAFIKQPPVLLLDEACTGLDDQHKDAFLSSLDRLMAATDITLVNMTHLDDEQPSCIKTTWRFEAKADAMFDLVNV